MRISSVLFVISYIYWSNPKSLSKWYIPVAASYFYDICDILFYDKCNSIEIFRSMMRNMMHKIEKYRASKTFNLGRLIQMVPDQRSRVEFLQCVNVLPTTVSCSKCQADCSNVIYPEKLHYVHFYCQPCRTKMSIRKNTFFYRSHISFRRMLLLAYGWTQLTWSYQQIVKVYFLLDGWH